MRRIQNELKKTIRECKDSYRNKMEEQLQQNSVREVWKWTEDNVWSQQRPWERAGTGRQGMGRQTKPVFQQI